MEKHFLGLQKAIKTSLKKILLILCTFIKLNFLRNYSQETTIMQTGVCCGGTVKFDWNCHINIQELLLHFKEQFWIIDTQKIHEQQYV